MKKLLLCVLTLVSAVAINAMENNQATIAQGGIFAGISALSGFVMRASSSSQANTTITPVVDANVSVPAPIVAGGALRQEEYGSQTDSHGSRRSYTILPYPADDSDDEWHEVTIKDAKVAAAMHKAQGILGIAQLLLPNDLKSCINTNIHEASNPLKELEEARELIWACMTRTDEDFAESYITTLTKNFEPCKQYDPTFDVLKVYAYFKYADDFGTKEPNETFAQLIKEKLEKASAEGDEKTQWFMRQFGFMFRDPATKQTYDVYLKGGKEALEKLAIPGEQRDALQDCFDAILEMKHSLQKIHPK